MAPNPPYALGAPAQPWRPSTMRFVHGLCVLALGGLAPPAR